MSLLQALGLEGYDYQPYQVDKNAGVIPGASTWGTQLNTGAVNAGGRQAQQATAAQAQGAQIDGAAQGDVRGRQMGLADALAAQANGQGPSLAQAQLQQGLDANLRAAASQAASARGAGAPALQRALMYQRGDLTQQTAADAATLRLQEQMQARNALAGVLGGARGQDLQLAEGNAQLAQQTGLANAQMQQQTNLANQQAGLQQQSLNDNLVQFYVAQGLSLVQAQQQAAMQLQQLQSNNYNSAQGLTAGSDRAAAQNAFGMLQGGLQGLGAKLGLPMGPSK